MSSFVSKNLQIIPTDSATISAMSSAFLYGYGIFTTIAIYNREPFQWQLHLQRLHENADRLKIKFPYSDDDLKAALKSLIDRNNLENGRARITIFEEEAPSIWSSSTIRQTSVFITTAEPRETNNELRLTVSPYRVNSRSALKGVKSCNYLENLLALELAKSEGFDEALRLNEKDEVTSACMANIFWIEDETVFTPASETGCLEGTTRAAVIEICRELGFEVYASTAELEEIYRADEVFLTSAGLGIASVRKISDQFFEDEKTRTIRSSFYKKIASL